MFKKGDKVVHSDYGTGEIWKVNPNDVVKHKDKNNIQISHKGTIQIAFDSVFRTFLKPEMFARIVIFF